MKTVTDFGTVSILAEIPEELHTALLSFMETHKGFDQDRAFTAALSLFLFQNADGNDRKVAANTYLDAFFGHAHT